MALAPRAVMGIDVDQHRKQSIKGGVDMFVLISPITVSFHGLLRA